MTKRKSDEQLQQEIHQHSSIARASFALAHDVHKQALQIGLDDGNHLEHAKIMSHAIALERLAITESKKVVRLEEVLFNRQMKNIKKQRFDLKKLIPF